MFYVVIKKEKNYEIQFHINIKIYNLQQFSH